MRKSLKCLRKWQPALYVVSFVSNVNNNVFGGYFFFITNDAVFFLVSFSVRLLGKVEVPLGELLSNNEIERSYDLVDGKNNPTLVSTIINDLYW